MEASSSSSSSSDANRTMTMSGSIPCPIRRLPRVHHIRSKKIPATKKTQPRTVVSTKNTEPTTQTTTPTSRSSPCQIKALPKLHKKKNATSRRTNSPTLVFECPISEISFPSSSGPHRHHDDIARTLYLTDEEAGWSTVLGNDPILPRPSINAC
jgi:hypothetical protein